MRYGAIVIAVGVAAVSGYELAFSQGQETCSTVMDCAQKAMEAAYQAKTAIRIAVPKGAVMAFNLKECPDGWVALQPLVGRVIVGAGIDVTGALTERKLGEKGGEEKHQLTVEEMSAHSHSFTATQSGGGCSYSGCNGYSQVIPNQTDSQGGNVAHNIMQPYYVLTYCERT